MSAAAVSGGVTVTAAYEPRVCERRSTEEIVARGHRKSVEVLKLRGSREGVAHRHARIDSTAATAA